MNREKARGASVQEHGSDRSVGVPLRRATSNSMSSRSDDTACGLVGLQSSRDADEPLAEVVDFRRIVYSRRARLPPRVARAPRRRPRARHRARRAPPSRGSRRTADRRRCAALTRPRIDRQCRQPEYGAHTTQRKRAFGLPILRSAGRSDFPPIRDMHHRIFVSVSPCLCIK